MNGDISQEFTDIINNKRKHGQYRKSKSSATGGADQSSQLSNYAGTGASKQSDILNDLQDTSDSRCSGYYYC